MRRIVTLGSNKKGCDEEVTGERGFWHAGDVIFHQYENYNNVHVITMLNCTYVLSTFLNVCFISHNKMFKMT